ncbi:MAG: hypothetical protein HY354_04610, partial [Planctomycetes bacterium]|nr:hypothetical protein [Planctomycetota bacterium]
CRIPSSNISRYEAGKTGEPSSIILRTFSIIYKTPLVNIARVLMEEKYGIKLDEGAGSKFVKEPEPLYDLKVKEIVEMLRKLNESGLASVKAATKGFLEEKKFLH